MKKLIKLEDAIGKTITGFREWDEGIIIIFDAGYSYYVVSGYGVDLQELKFDYNGEKQIGLELGLVSLEDIKQLENEAKLREQQWEIERKQHRLEQYKALKKEFENDN